MAESAILEQLIAQYAENPRRVFARLANEYRKRGDLDNAIQICRAQVPLQPTYVSGYIVLGQALFESGQLDDARATFESAVGLDPENLIALRHLGDIARHQGDLDAARGWYYRLLEVDPQNDEVKGALQSLEAPAAEAPRAAGEEQVSWSDINPEHAPPAPSTAPPMPRLTLGMIPEAPAAEEAKPAARATKTKEMVPPSQRTTTEAVPPSQRTTTEAVPPSQRATAPAPVAPPSPAIESAPTMLMVPVTKEILAPTAPPAAPPAAPPKPPAPPAARPAPELEITGLEELSQFSSPIAPPPPPPPPVVAELPPLEAMTGEFSTPPAPPRSSAPELIPEHDYRAPRDHPEEEEPPLWSPPTTGEHVIQRPPAVDALRDTLAFPTPKDVPAVEAAPPAAPAMSAPPAPPAPPPAAAVPRASSTESPYDPTVGRMLELSGTTGGDVPAEYMTETMAELYLQQGYTQEALQIYRQLAASRPDDASLRERIARLEKGGRSSLSVGAISEDVITAAQKRASKPAQTSRSFFGGLASRRAPATPPSGSATAPAMPAPAMPAPAMPAPAMPAPAMPAPAMPVAPPAPAAAASEATTKLRTPTEISRLFSDRVAEGDDAAAAALASAFSEDFAGPTPPAAAQPSRAATQPLSLDAVFRGQRPTTDAQRASPSVTFDEFFSPRDSGAVAAIDPSAPARPHDNGQPEADLALFHEWLDGLKK